MVNIRVALEVKYSAFTSRFLVLSDVLDELKDSDIAYDIKVCKMPPQKYGELIHLIINGKSIGHIVTRSELISFSDGGEGEINKYNIPSGCSLFLSQLLIP